MNEQRWTGLEIDGDSRPTWLTVGLQRALGRPGGDPVSAVLGAVRLIRSGTIDSAGRRMVHDRLVEWLDDTTCERVATAVEGHAQTMLEFLHAWVSSDPDADEALAQAGWTSGGWWPEGDASVEAERAVATRKREEHEDRIAPPCLSAWDLVVDRDDAESLVTALTMVVLATKRDAPTFWERRARERLEGPDRIAGTLGIPLARLLQPEAAPAAADWVRGIASQEPSCWWLDAVLRSEAIQCGLLPDIATGPEPGGDSEPWHLARVEFRASACMSDGTGVRADDRIAGGKARILSRHAVTGLESDEVVIELRAVDWDDDGRPDRRPGLVVGFESAGSAVITDVQIRPVLSSPPMPSEATKATKAWWVPLEGEVPRKVELEVKVRLGERDATVRLPLCIECVPT